MTVQHKSPLVDQWIEKAENDLRNATIVVREKDPPTDTVCFHCHQVAEKYLKAYLIARHLASPRVHDLGYLLNQCIALDPAFAELEAAMATLNGYYIESRYPLDFPIHYSLEEAQQAVDLAHEIRGFIAEKINTASV